MDPAAFNSLVSSLGIPVAFVIYLLMEKRREDRRRESETDALRATNTKLAAENFALNAKYVQIYVNIIGRVSDELKRVRHQCHDHQTAHAPTRVRTPAPDHQPTVEPFDPTITYPDGKDPSAATTVKIFKQHPDSDTPKPHSDPTPSGWR